ncbi:hypothetical protein VTG60DRAFT_6784 [Thermothelomyces hinnuleus]
MSPSSPEDGRSESSGAAVAAAHEPLACVTCRSRKLKCDRQKPVCARCAKAGGECVYPESRRKPATKRRSVKELEERLAQVEGLLKTVHRPAAARTDGASTEGSSPSTFGGETSRPERPQAPPSEWAMPWKPLSPNTSSSGGDDVRSGELLGLGRFESLPPFEMIEDLHAVFFGSQPHFMPLIHPGNYLRAFHSPPHMRPPMCLQYAIWSAASNGHPKYGLFHDALYRRARQYLEADELKGQGEHFITIGHAQAWAIIASDEARSLLFTRACMSSGKAVRLAGMMGLHRLDSPHTQDELPMSPMIPPPRSWAELEERRRLFWGTYCMDCYGSISAGWPTLVDVEQVTTHLPVSEDAFVNGTEEPSFPLEDAFRGSSYSKFGANVVICRIFTRLVNHAHRPLPHDRPEDVECGAFWKRHRELDNLLSSTFMFLPERYRLPQNIHDLNAVQFNVNLHAAVICLHLAAREKAERFKLGNIVQTSQTRCLTAAQEIIDILKTSKNSRVGYKGPLMALSLYFAALTYIAQAKDNMDDLNRANLEFIIRWMKSTEISHVITHAYLQQLLRDLKGNGISVSVGDIPELDPPVAGHSHGVPLIAKSRHAKLQSPLPGRLPLGAPQGTLPTSPSGAIPACATLMSGHSMLEEDEGHANKRMRTSAGPGAGGPHRGPAATWTRQMTDTTMDPAPDLFEYTGDSWSYTTKYTINPLTVLPTHRTGSPAINRFNMADTINFNFSAPGPAAGPPPAFCQLDPPGLLPNAGFGMHDIRPDAAISTAAAAAAAVDTNQSRQANNPPNDDSAAADASANLHLAPDLPDLGDIFSMDQQWNLSESIYAMLDMANPTTSQSGGDNLNAWAALNNDSSRQGPTGG